MLVSNCCQPSRDWNLPRTVNALMGKSGTRAGKNLPTRGRTVSGSVGEFREQVGHALLDFVANRPHRVQLLSVGVVQSPVAVLASPRRRAHVLGGTAHRNH